QQRADAHALAGVAVATQEHVVGGHLAVAVRRLDGRAVEPDVADVVLAAGVRAAADVDQDLARALVRDVHQLHLLADGPVEAHRAGDAQLAGVRAGAGDDVRDLTDAPTPEAQLAEGLPDVVDGAFRDPAQHDLLPLRGAGASAAVGAEDGGEASELRGGQIALWHLHLDRDVAGLPLRLDARALPVLEGCDFVHLRLG